MRFAISSIPFMCLAWAKIVGPFCLIRFESRSITCNRNNEQPCVRNNMGLISSEASTCMSLRKVVTGIILPSFYAATTSAPVADAL